MPPKGGGRGSTSTISRIHEASRVSTRTDIWLWEWSDRSVEDAWGECEGKGHVLRKYVVEFGFEPPTSRLCLFESPGEESGGLFDRMWLPRIDLPIRWPCLHEARDEKLKATAHIHIGVIVVLPHCLHATEFSRSYLEFRRWVQSPNDAGMALSHR